MPGRSKVTTDEEGHSALHRGVGLRYRTEPATTFPPAPACNLSRPKLTAPAETLSGHLALNPVGKATDIVV